MQRGVRWQPVDQGREPTGSGVLDLLAKVEPVVALKVSLGAIPAVAEVCAEARYFPSDTP
jgi:hypothetical protein